jgi:hypothetical protein
MSAQYTSRVVATMAALLEALQGASFDAPDVEVDIKWPTDLPAQESVYVQPRVEATAQQVQSTFGPGNRQESFGLVVAVTTATMHPDCLSAMERLSQMTDAVETAVRLHSVNTPNNRHPRPDVDGVLWWEVSSGEPEGHPTDQGWWADCRMVVSVRAHI